MRRLYLPLLLAALPATAQVAPDAPLAETPDPEAPADLLAFAQAETRMTVPVSIAGAGPYHFVIDTGAQRTVISRELAGTLGLPKGRVVRLTAMSGTSNVGTVMIPSLSVSTLGGSKIEAPALNASFLGAPGMLGVDSLQGHALSIDFDKQEMAVRPSNKRTRKQDRLPNEIVVQAKNLFGQLVVTNALCNGERVRVILDTGSAVSMGNLALRKRFMRRGRKLEPLRLLSVTGGVLEADYGEISQVRLGGVTIERMPVAFADAAPFRQFGLADTPAILLGMDALKLFRRVQIDFANKELRLALPRDVRYESPLNTMQSMSRLGQS